MTNPGAGIPQEHLQLFEVSKPFVRFLVDEGCGVPGRFPDYDHFFSRGRSMLDLRLDPACHQRTAIHIKGKVCYYNVRLVYEFVVSGHGLPVDVRDYRFNLLYVEPDVPASNIAYPILLRPDILVYAGP